MKRPAKLDPAEIETRLGQLAAEVELARAWASLNSLLPDTKEPS